MKLGRQRESAPRDVRCQQIAYFLRWIVEALKDDWDWR